MMPTIVLDGVARWQRLRRLPSVRMALLGVLFILAVLMPTISLSSGQVAIPADHVTQFISDRVSEWVGQSPDSHLDYDDRLTQRDQILVLDIRLPRIVLGALVGAGLALAGVALQGVFRNPLADPGLIGVNSGAAMGAVTAIAGGWSLGPVFGLADGGELARTLAAFSFALLTTLLIYRLAYRQTRTNSATLLLVGLAINTIATAYVGLVTFTADQGAAGDITFWTLGDLSGTFWQDVRLMIPFFLVGLLGLPWFAYQLNLLALGESEARHLGVQVERVRWVVLALSALMVSVGVAMAGIIGFVGLVVPHLMRFLFGPDHRTLLPASALGGVVFLVTADTIARTIAPPTEIPLGILTTLVGGPFFLMLILVYRRQLA